MKDLGYGEGYQYAHDYEEKMTKMQCLPDSLEGKHYYEPSDQGMEVRMAQRLEKIRQWKDMERRKK